MKQNLLTSFGRMFPDCSVPTAEEISRHAYRSWSESGIVEHGQILMLDGLALHSADDAFSECSLSEILEPVVAQKYFLSPRAAAGILRRAEKRGRKLPPALLEGLTQIAKQKKAD
jgi:hypothetical protein